MKEEKKVLHELRLDKSIIKLLWAPALVGQLQKLVQKFKEALANEIS